MGIDIRSFIRQEIIEYTKMSPTLVDQHIGRDFSLPISDHKKEWTIWNPRNLSEINKYYRTSATYLFTNARHVMPEIIYEDVFLGSSVFDMGAGVGSNSIPLAIDKNATIYHFDINLYQRDFVKSLARRHPQIKIKIIDDVDYMPIGPDEQVDVVLALDVFEHMPNYDIYVQWVGKKLKDGGAMYVIAPFDNMEPSHFKDSKGFMGVCDQNKLVHDFTSGKVSKYVKK